MCSGKGIHDVEWFFHFAPNIEVMKKNNHLIQFKKNGLLGSVTSSYSFNNNQKFKIFNGQKDPAINGWCTQSYGQLLKTNKLVSSFNLKFPIELSHTIGWDC